MKRTKKSDGSSTLVLKSLKNSFMPKKSPNYTEISTKTLNATFFLSNSLMFVVLYCGYGDLFFKAVPCQRYFGGNIVMGANFLRKNVTFSATLFVAIKHPF